MTPPVYYVWVHVDGVFAWAWLDPTVSETTHFGATSHADGQFADVLTNGEVHRAEYAERTVVPVGYGLPRYAEDLLPGLLDYTTLNRALVLAGNAPEVPGPGAYGVLASACSVLRKWTTLFHLATLPVKGVVR